MGTDWARGSAQAAESMAITGTDAAVECVSTNGGTWGSGFTLKDVNSTTFVNTWSMTRKTSGSDNSLHFLFGTDVEHTSNTSLLAIDTTGNVTPGGNKTQDMGVSGTAWDDCYADDFQNEADFYHFDEYDDLATLHQIKGSGKRQEHNGYELIDDSTLPDWLCSKHKKTQEIKYVVGKDEVLVDGVTKGEKIISPDGNPFLSLKTMISLLMGAVRQLDNKNTKVIQELTAKVEALEWVSDFKQYASNPLVEDLLAGNYKEAIETILDYNNK